VEAKRIQRVIIDKRWKVSAGRSIALLLAERYWGDLFFLLLLNQCGWLRLAKESPTVCGQRKLQKVAW
jgi:hypothetical protein